VRNPIDVLPSMLYMVNSASHSLVPKEIIHEECQDYWDWFIRFLPKEIKWFHTIMTERAAAAIPTYYLTYEDLRLNSEPAVLEMFQFMFDVPSLDGTVLEAKIKSVCAEGHSSKTVYKLKSTSTNMSRNAFMYNDA